MIYNDEVLCWVSKRNSNRAHDLVLAQARDQRRVVVELEAYAETDPAILVIALGPSVRNPMRVLKF